MESGVSIAEGNFETLGNFGILDHNKSKSNYFFKTKLRSQKNGEILQEMYFPVNRYSLNMEKL